MMRSQDLPQIGELYAQQEAYANTLQLPYPAGDQWQSLLTRPGHTSLVAVNAEEILGHTGIDMLSRARRRHVATFGLAVKASERGKGVGSALVAAAVDVCDRWANIIRIELQVYTDNHAAIAIYQKHGFVIEGTGRQYAIRDGALVDAHYMVRLKNEAAVRPDAR
jgi:putative acetyltransferase